MAALVCPYCFNEFAPSRLLFRCLEHNPPLEFEWRGGALVQPPASAPCSKGLHLCGIRLCPECRHVLPYYLGRSRTITIAIAGPRGTGKTVYLWSLLHELRGRLARDPDPFLATMFEDEESFAICSKMSISIFDQKEMPEATQARTQVEGNLPPISVRLWRGSGLMNLSLYDPAGELIDNLQKIAFLTYLRHASALIYLFQPPGPFVPEEAQSAAAAGLGNIAHYLRRSLGLGQTRPIPRTLAVVMTQADREVFRDHPPSKITPGYGHSQKEWKRWGWRIRRRVRAAGAACKDVLRSLGYDELVNNAEQNFGRCEFFAVSSLGDALRDGELDPTALMPVGVECPLFWCLNVTG